MLGIGEKLRNARIDQNLSLRELAAKTDVSASLLSQIENEKANPSVRTLHSLADALAIRSFQGRASDDSPAIPFGQCCPYIVEPGRAVCVGQRRSGGHLGDIAGRVQVIAVEKRGTEARSQRRANRRFAAARDPHRHEKAKVTETR